MPTPLFTDDEATDPAYRNIRDAKKGPLDFARWLANIFGESSSVMPTRNFAKKCT
jgi:hypothetical protein